MLWYSFFDVPRAKGANVTRLKRTRVAYAEERKEVGRPYRLVVLRVLVGLDAKSPGALFPLSSIATPDVPDRYVRTALRGLYRTGMITARAGSYGLTYNGRTIYRVLMRQMWLSE